jgi:hypothetical protein
VDSVDRSSASRTFASPGQPSRKWDYEGRVIEAINRAEARVGELEDALGKALRLVHFDMLDSREYHEIKEVLSRGV